VSRSNRWWVVAAAGCLFPAASLGAYVDLAPTLARVVREAQTITVAEVDRFSPEKGAVLLKKVRDLKGETGADPSSTSWCGPARRGWTGRS